MPTRRTPTREVVLFIKEKKKKKTEEGRHRGQNGLDFSAAEMTYAWHVQVRRVSSTGRPVAREG